MSDLGDPGRTAAAGWYPDPWFSGQQRYWDGERWTSDVFTHAIGQTTGYAAPGVVGAAPSTPAVTPPPPPAWGAEPPAAAWPPAPTEYEQVEAGPAEADGSRWLKVGAAVAVLALVVGSLGWLALRRDDAPNRAAAALSARPTPSPTPSIPRVSPSPSPSPSPTGANAALLANLVVRQQDVDPPVTVAPINGGTQTDGEVTLDLCNGTYPSEALRLERLQVAAFDPAGTALFSTEAVLYRSAAATEQAFAELRAVVKACPTTAVTNPTTGTTSTTTFGPAPDTSWARTKGVDRQAYSVTTTGDNGAERQITAVYLRRGPVLLGLYFLDPTSPPVPVEGRTTVPAIVKLFEERLLKSADGSGLTA